MAGKIIGYADFETIHERDYEAHGYTIEIVGRQLHVFREGVDTGMIPESRIKCACMVIGEKEIVEFTISDFLYAIYENKVSRCYFHNLAFDESYISSILLENDNQLWLEDDMYCTCTKRSIGFQNAMYSVTIAFIKASNGKPIRSCEFRDSAKIWAQKLEKLGEMVGVKKGDNEGVIRALEVGCSDKMIEYCLQDCRVLQAVMEQYFDMVSNVTNGQKKGWLTSASTAYNLGMWWISNKGKGTMSEKKIASKFPACNAENGFPDWLREGYKGATPLLDERIKGKILHDVTTFDINSDYPYQMCTQKLPVGKPQPIPLDKFWAYHDTGGLWVAKTRMRIKVKKGHRATFLLKHKGPNGSTLADSLDTDDCTIDENGHAHNYEVVNSVDFELIERDYDIEYFQPIEAYAFASETGVFKDFLMYWYDVKSKYKGVPGKEALVAFAKLIINSFYGKFGTNPDFIDHYEELGEDGIIKLRECEEVNPDKNPKYLPFAMFCTSHARNLLSKVCNLVGWENVAYTDTDSIHVYNKPGVEFRQMMLDAGYICDKTTLGGWDMEEECEQAVYLRPKGYIHADAEGKPLTKHGEIVGVKMAGANVFDHLHKIEDFIQPDAVAYSKASFRVIGGRMIELMPRQLNKDSLVTRVTNRRTHKRVEVTA